MIPFKFRMEDAIRLFLNTKADGFCDVFSGKNSNGDLVDLTVRKKAMEMANGSAEDPKFFKEDAEKSIADSKKQGQEKTWYARGYPDTSLIDKKQTVYYVNGWTCFKHTLQALITAEFEVGEIEQYLRKAFKPIKDIPLQNYITFYTTPQIRANNVLVVAAATTDSALWTVLEKTSYPFVGF
ncbi:hypothetical protein MMC11_001918 [Xylographa trunciseda]|nr:hypothetical protein [Xylographa trunciseda]